MIKKLFTSLLLLGVALCGFSQPPQNPFTVSYADGTMTVNFDSTKGNGLKVQDLKNRINECFEPIYREYLDNLGLTGPENKEARDAARDAKIIEDVNNVKFTGDWTNNHLAKEGPIYTAIMRVNGSNGTGIDLSACQGFDSRFVSVEDKLGDTVYGPNEWLPGNVGDVYTVTFTSLPELSTTTENRSNPVTVEDKYNPVQVRENQVDVTVVSNPVTIVHNKAAVAQSGQANAGNVYTFNLPTEYVDNVKYPVTSTPDYGQGGQVIHHDGNWYYICSNWNDTEYPVTEVTTYSYEDENGNQVVQTDTEGLNPVEENGTTNYYYDRYVYYRDQAQSDKVAAPTTDGLTPDGNGGYIYVVSTTYSYVKLENGQEIGKSQSDTSGLTQDADGAWWYIQYIYYTNPEQTGNPTVTDSTNGLTEISEGTYGYYVGTYYTYYDENGEEKVQNQDYTSNLTYHSDTDTWTYDYEETVTVGGFSFEGYGKVFSSISFPASANFTYIPDGLMLNQTYLTSVVIPNNVEAIGNKAFENTALSGELVLSQNITEIGGLAFEGTNLGSVNLSNTKIKRLRYGTFEDCLSLVTVTFPNTLIEIQKVAFADDELLESVDLSGCHHLRMIAGHAFQKCQGLLSVTVCSHPKTIKGGEGSGAFNTCQHIQRVEITACSHIEGIEDVTDVTRCWCEAGAFDALVTRVQTQFENASQGAHLIFPRTAPVLNSGNFENPYASAFDFFVGDYKAGAPINQSNLQVFYKDVPVPNEGYSVDGFGEPVNQPSLPALVGDARYNNNGWLEFINIDELEIIVPNDKLFLRTYSRTAGTGPVLLPVGDDAIHAFRVLDYRNTTEESDFEGEVVKDEDGNLLTLKGYIVLKELTVKDKNGVTRGYVPENTGVVYYSKKIDEVAGLILKEATTADLAEGESFTEYPNTDTAYDQNDPATTTSSVNMLVPSKGDPIGVTPTSPWNDKKNCYENPRTHRNFSLDATAKKWKRVKVGTLRANRAYVHLPISRFNNEDEPDAMNDFNEEDNGLTNLTAVGMIFEGDEATEIITIDAKGNITQDEGWYTLQGVKVTRPTKGVYIHNNKKVVFK